MLTGASHTGKTLLAQRMLEKYKYPYLSIDHLKMGLIRSGNTELGPEDDDALTEYLWPIVREMIKTAIENRQNLIVEGCYIPFHWRQDFDARYLPSIRFICLAMSEGYLRDNFRFAETKTSIPLTRQGLVDGIGFSSTVETIGSKHQSHCPKACGDSRVDDEKQIKAGRHREQDLRGDARQAGVRYSDHGCEEGRCLIGVEEKRIDRIGTL